MRSTSHRVANTIRAPAASQASRSDALQQRSVGNPPSLRIGPDSHLLANRMTRSFREALEIASRPLADAVDQQQVLEAGPKCIEQITDVRGLEESATQAIAEFPDRDRLQLRAHNFLDHTHPAACGRPRQPRR